MFGAPLLGLAVASLLSRFQRSSLIQDSPLSTGDLLTHLKNHTIVHIGGQHRGGTTLLWGGLEGHSAIAGHRLPPDAIARARRRLELAGGLERSGLEALSHDPESAPTFEGVFLQDVYPRFSLDRQSTLSFQLRLHAARLSGRRLLEGVGSYALAPSSHLGGRHSLASREAAISLFRQVTSPTWAIHRENMYFIADP